MTLRVSLLGDVRLRADALPQPGLRVLLAMLALSANRVVPAAALIDALWQEEPSRPRERNLHAQVYQLRRRLAALEPDRQAARLVRREPGYLLLLADDELDLAEFRSLAARGRAAADDGDHAVAAELLRSGLALWRGPALADAARLCDRLAAEAALLEEQRLAVLEDRIEADLAAGQLAGLPAELAQVAAEHPLRERLTGLLMLALYRSGRQAEALQAFEGAREVLADTLGIDPGVELRALHQRILRGDAATGTGPAVVPRQLPAGLSRFVGRKDELKELDQLLDAAADAGGALVITAIGGTGGIGKSALALHWAHRVAHRFPDGQLHLSLRGFEPGGSPVSPGAALQSLLTGLGVPPQQVPADTDARTALYRSLLAGRRMLVVLDNARDPAQVRPLLPASPGSLVIVTSRSAMTGLTTSDGATPVPLGLLPSADAHALLTARLGIERVGTEPDAVAALIRACAGLPLALAIVAARAAGQPSLPLSALVDELSRMRLDALDTGELATSARAVFASSVEHLPAPAARMFRLLGLHPGPDITVAAAASLSADSGARRLLTEMAAASLLTEHVPGRYAMHDLLRAYARELATATDSEPERAAAIDRALDHYLHTAHAATLRLRAMDYPIVLDGPEVGVTAERIESAAAATAWFAAEHEVLLEALSLAVATGRDSRAWQIPWTMANYQFMQGLHSEWIAVSSTALDAAGRLGEDAALGWAHYRLGHAIQEANRLTAVRYGPGSIADSQAHYRAAVEHFALAGMPAGEAVAHLGLHFVSFLQDRPDRARQHMDRAIALYRQAGSPRGTASALSLLGYWHIHQGDPAAALDPCSEALTIYRAVADEFGVAHALTNLGNAQSRLGEFAGAIARYSEALDLYRLIGHRTAMTDVLTQLGDAHESLGEVDEARAAWRQALDISGDAYPQGGEYLRRKLYGT